MRIITLLLALVLLGCQSERSSNSNKEAYRLKPIKNYKKEHHLFLNYYFGMTIEEYETATKHNFMTRKLYLPGEKDQCDLSHYSHHHHTHQDIENINYHSNVYYAFSLDDEEFEASLKPVFKYEKLIRLEMQTLNCFTFGNHSHDFYRRKIASTRKALIDLHQQEFGRYSVTPKKHNLDEMAVIANAGVNISHFDTNKYTFKHQNKVVTIEQKCCDFKPLVIYSHAEFLEIQKQPDTPEKLEREFKLFNSVEAI
ncbi:hypothetical protein [Flavobacterium sp.]|uniref:hypothetical protein n=1 Tax=Flavobacterium sp. TaxID=239 RepID=UPI0039E424A0